MILLSSAIKSLTVANSLSKACGYSLKSSAARSCNGTSILIISTGCGAWSLQEIAWWINQLKCQPYSLTCRWQTRRLRIICWFFGAGCDQTNINYSYADSWLGSHSLFTAYHQLSCKSYWKVNEKWWDTKAAQASLLPFLRYISYLHACLCACLCVQACIPSGGCNRRRSACHFLIIDNEAHWDCREKMKGKWQTDAVIHNNNTSHDGAVMRTITQVYPWQPQQCNSFCHFGLFLYYHPFLLSQTDIFFFHQLNHFTQNPSSSPDIPHLNTISIHVFFSSG